MNSPACPYCGSTRLEHFNGGTNIGCMRMYTCKICRRTFKPGDKGFLK